MTTITITCAFSGFANIADNMIVGSHGDVSGTENSYILPAGYTVAEDKVFDSYNIECFVEGRKNGVMLISKAGVAADVFMASL